MKSKSTKIIISTFFILALLCVIIFVVATYQNMRQTEIESTKLRNSLSFLVLTEDLLSKVEDLENTQRGYIFSSRENFKIPYLTAITKLEADTSRLNNMLLEIPEKANPISELKSLVIKNIETSRQLTSLYDNGGINPVLEMMDKGINLKITDSIKKSVFQIENTDRNLLNQSN